MTTASAQTQTTYSETVLHSFASLIAPNGASPGALVRDPAGNLYGITIGGGAWGQGVVFKIDAAGQQTVLYSFRGGADGARPIGGLIRDEVGNLYGTTLSGGNSCDVTPDPSCGVVFKIDAAGQETVVYAFTGGNTGFIPYSGVVRDSAGNLYGTTAFGGKSDYGVVFKVDPSGHEIVLHSFTGGADGGIPNSGVLLDSGNLYGTTTCGGAGGGCPKDTGVVYRLDAAGHETVLYNFTGGTDGGYPLANLVGDADGNLYGTTDGGGTANQGVVFKLNPAGQETVLFNFPGGADGGGPSGIFRDPAGNPLRDHFRRQRSWPGIQSQFGRLGDGAVQIYRRCRWSGPCGRRDPRPDRQSVWDDQQWGHRKRGRGLCTGCIRRNRAVQFSGQSRRGRTAGRCGPRPGGQPLRHDQLWRRSCV